MIKNQYAISKTRTEQLVDDVLTSIEAVYGEFASVNKPTTVTLYWRIGHRINEELGIKTDPKRIAWITSMLAERLREEDGNEFTAELLRKTMAFAKRFPDYKAVITMSSKMDWQHFQQLIDIDDDIKRDFYAWMCFVKEWSTKTLHTKIQGALYEKTPVVQRTQLTAKGKASTNEDELLTAELLERNGGLLSWLGLTNR